MAKFPKILRLADGTEMQVNSPQDEADVLAKIMSFIGTSLGVCYFAADGSPIPLVLKAGGIN